MKQTVLVRQKMLRLIQNHRIYISCLPDTEMEALQKLQDPDVHIRIADYALMELGADIPAPSKNPEYFNKTKRAMAKVPGMKPKKRRYRKLSESWSKPKEAKIGSKGNPYVPVESITGTEVFAGESTNIPDEMKMRIREAKPSEESAAFNAEVVSA